MNSTISGVSTDTQKTLSGIVSYNSDITTTNTLQTNTLSVSTSIVDNGSLNVLGLSTFANVIINGTISFIAAIITFANITVTGLGTFLNITCTNLGTFFNLTCTNITTLLTLNVSGLSSLYNLTTTGITTLQNTTCNTLTVYGAITASSTASFIGSCIFTLPPILPSGYQFLTTLAQTITGAKTFSSSVNTAGIVDSDGISTRTLTLSNSIALNDANGGTTYNASFSQLNNNFICTLANTGNQAMWYMFGLAQPVLMTLNSTGLCVNYLLTCQNGLTINNGDFTSPNNSYINVVSCNAIQAITGTNVVVSATSFQIIPLAAGTLPSALTNIAGLITNWNCAGQGETDFINQSRENPGGFNFYSSPQTSLPALLMQIMPTGLTVNVDINALSILNVSTINRIDKTTPLIIYSASVPLPTAGTGSGAGLRLGWNCTGGGGKCDLISMGQGGLGGFNFYTVNQAVLPCSLLLSLMPQSMTLNSPFIPTSTATFNSYHPTTT